MKTYFDTLDFLFSLRIPKLKYTLALLYFPILIGVLVYSSYSIYGNIQLLQKIIICIYLVFSPMLIIPSYYFLKNKNFFIFRKFQQIINSCSSNFTLIEESFDGGINLSFHNCEKFIANVFILKKKEENIVSDKIIYKPNRKISKVAKEKLQEFYNDEAKSYFDICEYNFEYVFNLISGEKEISNEIAIKIFSDLKNNEIAKLISSLNSITQINKNQISLIFRKYNKKSGIVEFLKWNSIKSSHCQRSKLFRS